MTEPFKRVRHTVFRLLVRRGIVAPIAWLCARSVGEVHPDGGRAPAGVPTLLALNPDRFRGDLEVLARGGEFRVLRLPFEWQGRLVLQFYAPDAPGGAFFRPETDPAVARAQRDLRRFLRRFLPALYRRLGVDCVLSAAAHYRHDLDWAAVSEELGVPCVVLHRENLVTNAAHYRRFVDFSKSLGRFWGSHIIVHNEVVREAFTRSGFVSPERISALGALRMDDYVRQVRSRARPARERPLVTLFSFAPGTGLFGLGGMWPKEPSVGFVRLFADTHVAVGQLARDHAEVDFVIKPKWGGHWIDEIIRVMEEGGVPPRALANLRITEDLDAQQLILESDVVVAFGSTTLLEAGIAGKPVVVPLFDEAASPEYADYIHLRDELDVFDVADSAESLKALVLERLAHPQIAPARLAAREALFERYVSTLRGDAAQRYAATIKSVIARRRGAAPGAAEDRALVA